MLFPALMRAFHPKVDPGFGTTETLQEKSAFHPKMGPVLGKMNRNYQAFD